MSIECYGKSTCECEFRAFLVGGGGDYGRTDLVGAGSGYLNYINEKLSLSSQVAQVQVGRFGQPSIITFANGLNYTAKPGQNTSWGKIVIFIKISKFFVRYSGDSANSK